MHRLRRFTAAFLALCAACTALSGVHAEEVPQVGDLHAPFSRLDATVSQVAARLQHLQRLTAGREDASGGAVGRRLSSTSPRLFLNHPDASVTFAQGASLAETDVDGTPALHARSHVVVDKDVHVKGSLHVDGANLNLAVPLNATEPLSRGDIVSMVSSGGVAKGFGMELSMPQTSAGAAAGRVQVVSHDGVGQTVLRTDDSGELFMVFTPEGAPASNPALSVSGPAPVAHFTATAVSPTALVVCYQNADDFRGYCRAAQYTAAWEFGAAEPLHATGHFVAAAVTNVMGATDRAVLVYTIVEDPDDPASAESFSARVVGVNGRTIGASVLPVSLSSIAADHLSAVSLSSQRVLIAFRVVQDASTKVQELFFPSADSVALSKFNRADVVLSGADDFTHTALARLDASRALLAFRSASQDSRVLAATLDVSVAGAVSVGPLTAVNSGAVDSTGTGTLHLSVASPTWNRVCFSFLDASLHAVVVDAGVFGASIVVGSPQKLANDAAQSVSLVTVAPHRVMAVYAPAASAPAADTQLITGRVFGGPTALGFAKSSAASGTPVPVVLSGALDAFAAAPLRPGTRYYARYDGGLDLSVSSPGASSTIAGHALTPSTLMAVVRTLTDTDFEAVSDSARAVAEADADVETLKELVPRVERAVNRTHHMDKNLPVMYVWVTHVYSYHGSWYYGNNADYFGGIHPSHWSDSNALSYNMADDIDKLAMLFNHKMYCSWKCNIWTETWSYSASQNTMMIGTYIRVNNTNSEATTWTLSVRLANYVSWSERASITINGQNVWQRTDNNMHVYESVSLTVPPNRISTVIVMALTGNPNSNRPTYLGFDDDCLRLPEGMYYVDDLHHNTTGRWKADEFA